MNDSANAAGMEAPREEKSLFDQMQEMAMVGDEVTDPREGVHEGATLTSAELGRTKNDDPVVRLVWSFLDGDGTTLDVRTNENIATPEMNPQRQVMFREMLKDYGLLPKTVKNVIVAHDEATAAFIVRMFENLVEKGVPRTLTVKEANGFYRVRVRRVR